MKHGTGCLSQGLSVGHPSENEKCLLSQSISNVRLGKIRKTRKKDQIEPMGRTFLALLFSKVF